jgi:hypothetical protein
MVAMLEYAIRNIHVLLQPFLAGKAHGYCVLDVSSMAFYETVAMQRIANHRLGQASAAPAAACSPYLSIKCSGRQNDLRFCLNRIALTGGASSPAWQGLRREAHTCGTRQ